MARIRSYKSLSKPQLVRVIEDGYGPQRKYTLGQATRASTELEDRESAYQTWHAGQAEARENPDTLVTHLQRVSTLIGMTEASLRAHDLEAAERRAGEARRYLDWLLASGRAR